MINQHVKRHRVWCAGFGITPSGSEVPEADRRCRAEGPGQRDVRGAEKHGAGWFWDFGSWQMIVELGLLKYTCPWLTHDLPIISCTFHVVPVILPSLSRDSSRDSANLPRSNCLAPRHPRLPWLPWLGADDRLFGTAAERSGGAEAETDGCRGAPVGRFPPWKPKQTRVYITLYNQNRDQFWISLGSLGS